MWQDSHRSAKEQSAEIGKQLQEGYLRLSILPDSLFFGNQPLSMTSCPSALASALGQKSGGLGLDAVGYVLRAAILAPMSSGSHATLSSIFLFALRPLLGGSLDRRLAKWA